MRKIFILSMISLIFVFSNISFAGEIKVEINNEEEDKYLKEDKYFKDDKHIKEDKYYEDTYHYYDHEFDMFYDREEMNGLRINGGPMTAIMDLNLTKFNNNLPEEFSHLPETMILTGAGGLIGSKGGSRIGGYGLKGTVRSVSNNGQKANLELDYGGFLYEKSIYYTDSIDISIGSLIGGGTERIDLIYNNYQSMDIPNSNSYKKSFMVFEPRINMHYQFAVFLGMDLSFGYFINFDLDDDWEYFDDDVNLPLDTFSTPVTSIKFSVGF